MEKTISEQCKLIGEHPNSSFFYEWLESVDEPVTENKKHRHLSEKKRQENLQLSKFPIG